MSGEENPTISEEIYALANCYNLGINGKSIDKKKAFELYLKAANMGHSEAQCLIGLYYRDGEPGVVVKDFSKAAYWFTKSAEQGNPDGQHELGECYYFGKGVPQDYLKAYDLFAKSAEQGNEYAQMSLGNCYSKEDGVTRDPHKIELWYTYPYHDVLYEDEDDKSNIIDESSILGNPTTADEQYELAKKYDEGNDIPRDNKKASYWFEKAAENGHPQAQFEMGERYFQGIGVDNNDKKAFYWYKKAAENGVSEAQNVLADSFSWGQCGDLKIYQDDELSVYWYKKAAENGDFPSQLELGDIFWNGIKDTIPKIPKLAEYWYEKTTECHDGSIRSSDVYRRACDVGLSYLEGKRVPKDYDKAIYWLTKSYNMGDFTAPFYLGICYLNGYGVPKDEKRAVELITQVSELDCGEQYHLNMIVGEAQYYLGIIEAKKDGIENQRKAMDYFTKALQYTYLPRYAKCDIATRMAKYPSLGHHDEELDVLTNLDQINFNSPLSKEAINKLIKMSEGGNADSQYLLGKSYYYGDGISIDYNKAVYWLKLAANQNKDIMSKYYSEYLLGMCILEGKGVSKDTKKAVSIFKLMLKNEKYKKLCLNNLLYQLGICYLNGIGVSESSNSAIKYFKMAEDFPMAAYELWCCYSEGKIVKKDEKKAILYLKSAASVNNPYKNGCIDAQIELSKCYCEGKGVMKDSDIAEFWLEVAASNQEYKKEVPWAFTMLL